MAQHPHNRYIATDYHYTVKRTHPNNGRVDGMDDAISYYFSFLNLQFYLIAPRKVKLII